MTTTYTDAQIKSLADSLPYCRDATLNDDAEDMLRSLLAERQAAMQGQGGEVNADKLAERFHEAYERLAHKYGYRTRKKTSVPWKDVQLPNKQLMTAVCEELLSFVPPDRQSPQLVRGVSEGDVEAAMLAWSGYYCDCNDANVAGDNREAMRAALEHFAAIAQEKQS